MFSLHFTYCFFLFKIKIVFFICLFRVLSKSVFFSPHVYFIFWPSDIKFYYKNLFLMKKTLLIKYAKKPLSYLITTLKQLDKF